MGMFPDGAWDKFAKPGSNRNAELFRWDGGYGQTNGKIAWLKLAVLLDKLKIEVGFISIWNPDSEWARERREKKL